MKELTREEVISLVSEFRSEVKKCMAKIDFFNEKIEELSMMLEDGKSLKARAIVTADGHRVRRKEEKPRKPYPLSRWDKLILEIVKENKKPTASKDIYSKAFEKAADYGIEMGEEKMKAKINQCLVKLSGRRNDLMKIKTRGKGFAYCIPNYDVEMH